LTGVLVWLVGQATRLSGLSAVIPPSSIVGAASFSIIDSRNGTSLMLDRSGPTSRVVAQKAGSPNWFLVSQGDTTAHNPSLSPDGVVAAYLSDLNGSQLAIVSLDTGKRRAIPADDMTKLATSQNLGEWSFCSWTQLVFDQSA